MSFKIAEYKINIQKSVIFLYVSKEHSNNPTNHNIKHRKILRNKFNKENIAFIY